jgi:hypothetical protein
MSRLSFLVAFFAGFLSVASIAHAEESSSTVVNPATQESTTTTVDTNTDQTTVTKTNPYTGDTTTTVITTPAPAPQEAVAVPEGYANCFMVSAGWYEGKWIAEHKVCQYSQNNAQGVAWIDGHWVCAEYTAAEGACTKWEWSKGHWVNTFAVY